MKTNRFSLCVISVFILLLSSEVNWCHEQPESETEELTKQTTDETAEAINSSEDDTDQNDSDIELIEELPFDDEREFITVTTNYGDIKGFREVSSKGKPFYSYLGIPFAKPPVGELRFKNPEVPDKWDGERDGTVSSPPCSQIRLDEFLLKPNPDYVGDEDCLYLNVYTPRPNMSFTELPVLVYIHGGQYISGGAEAYKPHYLLNEEVVLVVIQYRLGIFGFLSTEDEVIPGNVGMRDQAKAIFWVHRNIEFFGGSPIKVTLFGSGAGAASVHLQVLSHHTIGLFSRVIMQSGNALCPWALGGVHKLVAHDIGNKFNCKPFPKDTITTDDNLEVKEISEKEEASTPADNEKEEEVKIVSQEPDDSEKQETLKSQETNGEDTKEESKSKEGEESEKESEEKLMLTSDELLQCLWKLDAKELTMVVDDYFMWNTFPSIFGPRIDENFLPSSPADLLTDQRHKRLDMMIGINRDEGSYITTSSFASEGRRAAVKSHFPLVGPISLEFTDDDLAPTNMSIKAYDYYIQGLDLDHAKANNFSKLLGDRHYAVCSDIAAIIHADNNIARKKNIYYYELHHKGSLSSIDKFNIKIGPEWISHGDELNYLFPNDADKERTEEDIRLTDIMTNMWRNFGSNGNPTYNEELGFQWEVFTSTDRKHLTLQPEPRMDDDYREEIRDFWASLPTQQNLILYPDNFRKKEKSVETDNKSQKDEIRDEL